MLAADTSLEDDQRAQAALQVQQDVGALSCVRQRASLLLHLFLSTPTREDDVDVSLVHEALLAVQSEPQEGPAAGSLQHCWLQMVAAGWQPVDWLTERQQRLLDPVASGMLKDYTKTTGDSLSDAPQRVLKALTAAGVSGLTSVASLHDQPLSDLQDIAVWLEDASGRGRVPLRMRLLVCAAEKAAAFCSSLKAAQPTVPLVFPQPKRGPFHIRYSGGAYMELLELVRTGRAPRKHHEPGWWVFKHLNARRSYTTESFTTNGVGASLRQVRGRHEALGTGHQQYLYKSNKERLHAVKSKQFVPSHTTGGGITTPELLAACKRLQDDLGDADCAAVDPGKVKLVHALGLGKLRDQGHISLTGKLHPATVPPAEDHYVVPSSVRQRYKRKKRQMTPQVAAAFKTLSTIGSLRSSDPAAILEVLERQAPVLQRHCVMEHYFGQGFKFARLQRRHRLNERRHDAHVVRQLIHTARHRAPRRFKPPTKLPLEQWSVALIGRVAKYRYPNRADRGQRAWLRQQLQRRRQELRRKRGREATEQREAVREAIRRKKAAQKELQPLVLIAFGDYSWGTGRGRAPAAHTRYVRLAARMQRTIVLLVDEWCTSKKCCWCGAVCSFTKRDAICPDCTGDRKSRDRDFQGAVNIAKVAICLLRDGARPLPWIRNQLPNRRVPKEYWANVRRLCHGLAREAADKAHREGQSVAEAYRSVMEAVAPAASKQETPAQYYAAGAVTVEYKLQPGALDAMALRDIEHEYEEKRHDVEGHEAGLDEERAAIQEALEAADSLAIVLEEASRAAHAAGSAVAAAAAAAAAAARSPSSYPAAGGAGAGA